MGWTRQVLPHLLHRAQEEAICVVEIAVHVQGEQLVLAPLQLRLMCFKGVDWIFGGEICQTGSFCVSVWTCRICAAFRDIASYECLSVPSVDAYEYANMISRCSIIPASICLKSMHNIVGCLLLPDFVSTAHMTASCRTASSGSEWGQASWRSRGASRTTPTILPADGGTPTGSIRRWKW